MSRSRAGRPRRIILSVAGYSDREVAQGTSYFSSASCPLPPAFCYTYDGLKFALWRGQSGLEYSVLACLQQKQWFSRSTSSSCDCQFKLVTTKETITHERNSQRSYLTARIGSHWAERWLLAAQVAGRRRIRLCGKSTSFAASFALFWISLNLVFQVYRLPVGKPAKTCSTTC